MAQTSPFHEHCEKCILVINCNVSPCPPFSCEILSCIHHCGARFHSCKVTEHSLMCPKEKVECINVGNGCPMLVQRNQMGSHLKACPASVIYCTMEWNRWPVYSKERLSKVPFQQDNSHARYGQLDVALALRDQRMLNKSMKVPRSTRRVLRNRLTQRFPAVPILARDVEPRFSKLHTSEDDDSKSNLENENANNAVTENDLLVATRQAASSLKNALSIANNESDEKSTGCEHKTDYLFYDISNEKRICVYCDKRRQKQSLLQSAVASRTEEDKINCTVCDDLGATENLHPHPDHQHENKQKTVDPNINSKEDQEEEILLDHTDIGIGSVVSNPNRNIIPHPPNPGLDLMVEEVLGLDLNIEQITKYQPKPASMYTFLCAQFFRRDEYSWHHKNLHGDIHSGMNGWIEERCPLAHSGCNYSRRRLFPVQKGTDIVYNSQLESFGIRPVIDKLLLQTEEVQNEFTADAFICSGDANNLPADADSSRCDDDLCQRDADNSDTSNSNQDFLTNLPFEILRHIAKYLDGFSMNNFALTCKSLREVASSLLEEKGLVVQQWDRVQENGKTHWYIPYHRWLYSTCFDPVHIWGFEDNPHLSQHLNKCPFYEKRAMEKPFDICSNKLLPPEEKQKLENLLRKTYPDFVAS